MAEIITDSAICWIFTYDAQKNLIQHPLEVVGEGSRVGYPDALTIVCEPTEADAEQQIINLDLKDPR
jgi:hypothetical protein